ncbi:uncharacterized protein LOC119741363 [Patiria miniata]|uniref:DUF7041 domain-containing protein n=1 Tax=Patiria miniata TaxID=46514 RepID=A0A914BC83_PATMI|nr:uncharacterized protein LOC119741363 [Patiria miniata]
MATKSEPQNPDSGGSSGASPVSAVALKLPPYWPNDPVIWFAQVEAQFLTRGIKSELTKYSYVIASLQPSIAQEVRDLLVNPPADNPYSKLKEELIKRTSESERKRLQKLLTTEELGDKKPSQLLRTMEQPRTSAITHWSLQS